MNTSSNVLNSRYCGFLRKNGDEESEKHATLINQGEYFGFAFHYALMRACISEIGLVGMCFAARCAAFFLIHTGAELGSENYVNRPRRSRHADREVK